MSEENKAVARRFYEEVFNQHRVDAIDQVCTPDFIDHSPMPGQAAGSQGLQDVFAMFIGAFPDMHVTIEEMIAERDLVVSRITVTGTHSGEIMGAPATGKRVTFHGMDMIRVRDGKASEVWHEGDDMMVLMELGVQPPG